jgi:hypothetical protein
MAIANPSRTRGNVFGPTGPSTTFGWLTDSHYDSVKATDTNKYYGATAAKVAAIAGELNATPNVDFVIQNGDWIDGCASKAQAISDLAYVTAAFNQCNMPRYHNVGNHDVVRLTKEEIHSITGQPGRYYYFDQGGVRFIVLDGNYSADDDAADLGNTGGAASPFVSYIPPTQRQWLQDTLAASPYPCLIICHYPIYYVGTFDWAINNSATVMGILEASGKVAGCLCGHLHDNFVRKVNGILYANIHATVTGPYPGPLTYAVVTVYPETKAIKIRAHGYEQSHIEG